MRKVGGGGAAAAWLSLASLSYLAKELAPARAGSQLKADTLPPPSQHISQALGVIRNILIFPPVVLPQGCVADYFQPPHIFFTLPPVSRTR